MTKESRKGLTTLSKTQCLICGIEYIIPTEGSVVLINHLCKITFNSNNGGDSTAGLF